MSHFKTQVKLAVATGSGLGVLPVKERLQDLKDRGIYAIARIVVFRDPFLAQKRPDLMVRTTGGSPLAAGTWVDPYSKEVQDYNLDLAIEAYQLGERSNVLFLASTDERKICCCYRFQD